MTTSSPEAPTSKKVPKSAMAFSATKFELASKGDRESGVRKAPIKLDARSAEPINHWYWGRIVHDMAGFSADAPVLPIDFRHDDGEEMGFVNKFQADNNGLKLEGEVVSLSEGDRVDTVLKKHAAGVPYQASIYFSSERLESVPRGFSTTVNGFTLEGPAIVVRKWSLRGVAICLYGADHRTKSQFSDAEQMSVDIFPMETQMSTNPAPTQTPSDNAGKSQEGSAQLSSSQNGQQTQTTEGTQLSSTSQGGSAPDPRKEVAAYVAKFGTENGVKWYTEGLSMGEASEKHLTALSEKLSAKDKEIADLQTKLGSVNRGEPNPVSMSDADKGTGTSSSDANKFSHLGDGLGRFAAGIKLPGSPSKN